MSDSVRPRLVTFNPTPARVLLDKLDREISRIEHAVENEHMADHVMNAFWTAWSLHQWVWEAIAEHAERRSAVLKYRGLDEGAIQDNGAFGVALAGRFVPLKICRIIAITPRQVRVAFSDDPNLAASSASGGNGEIRDITSLSLTPLHAVPAIVIMDRTVAAARLLREIEDYWVTLIHECGLEQLR